MNTIPLADSLKYLESDRKVCMLIQISKATTVEELMMAEAFVLMDKPKEEKKEPKQKPKQEKKPAKKTDTGKILALHKAGWNISSICLETGDSYYTVKKTIDQEKANDGEADS